jgi:hypothetical protein
VSRSPYSFVHSLSASKNRCPLYILQTQKVWPKRKNEWINKRHETNRQIGYNNNDDIFNWTSNQKKSKTKINHNIHKNSWRCSSVRSETQVQRKMNRYKRLCE